jgi:predicted ArsR family transcriptional regulator
MNQPDLFSTVVDPPYQRHSRTSRAAAEQIKPHVVTQRERILSALRRFGPQTDEQLQTFLGLDPSSERPRRIELVRDGLVVQDGEGVTSSGRRAARWRLA